MAAGFGNRRRSAGLALGLTACLAGAWSMSEPAGAQQRKTVWDKVYSSEQAERGKTEYATVCAGCHGKDLNGRDGGGQGPELAGPAFTKKWELQSLNQLYTEIKTRMPRNQPGTLTAEAYLNLVAFILESNKFPAGDEPLVADAALASTFITQAAGAKGTPAPAAITTGSLVQVIGCLQNSGGGWMLTQAAPPVRTENPDASPADQRSKLAATPAGTASLSLLGVYSALDEHKGHRMEAKGFLVKDPDGDRLNVVSLEMVATSCAP
jgi:S-disulfanyl-L-cysteine oxidoreductase SoxD